MGLFPVVIFVVVAVPLLLIAFFAMRRKTQAGEAPAEQDEADRQRTEDEFAAAEAYQEQWREEQHKARQDPLL